MNRDSENRQTDRARFHDLIAVGRISTDFYAQEVGSAFDEPQTFVKTIGGSPTNVACAAARLGNRTAVVTKVGGDLLGVFATRQLAAYGVDTTFVDVQMEGRTPVVLASLSPPEAPVIEFHRERDAPDTSIDASAVPEAALIGCRILWVSACALARGATAESCITWLQARAAAGRSNVLDIDYRPSFWGSAEQARLAALTAIDSSSIVTGNAQECEMVLGENDPDAIADSLLARGVAMAVVKLGSDGVLLATPSDRYRVPPIWVEVVCGLGSGDAFGGALVHGLLRNWSIDRIGEYGNAAGAFVATQIMCCDANPNLDELETFMDSHGRTFRERETRGGYV